QIDFFTRTTRVRTETAILAGYLHLNGAVAEKNSLLCAARLCESFETFVQVVPHTPVTFEHAVLLLRALRRDELQIRHCQSCEALVAADRLQRSSATCVRCTGAGKLRVPIEDSVMKNVSPVPVDFCNGDRDGAVRLGTSGAIEHLRTHGIVLSEGLPIRMTD